MPIARRVVNTLPSWTHQIETKHFTAFFRTKKERVEASSPAIHCLIGHRFDKVREIASSRGWELIDLRPARSRKT